MERPRLAAGTPTTLVPSIRMRPPVTSSRPAISRSSVVLPHPDGPTKTTKVPSSISRSAPWMTTWLPNALRTSCSVMWPMMVALLDCAEGEAAHQLALAEPAQHQDGCDGESRSGRELGPEQAFRARIGGDEDGERGGVGAR